MDNELNIDTFGAIMDQFLTENRVQMLIDIPEGTLKPQVVDNTGLGSVVQFYILLHSLQAVYKKFQDLIDPRMEEHFISTMLDLVKGSILNGDDT